MKRIMGQENGLVVFGIHDYGTTGSLWPDLP